MEGPHKGGTSHLRDEVRVDIRAIDGNRPLFADAKDVAKAFGGWVGSRPGPTTTLDNNACCLLTAQISPQNDARPAVPPPAHPPALMLECLLMIVTKATCIKGGQR